MIQLYPFSSSSSNKRDFRVPSDAQDLLLLMSIRFAHKVARIPRRALPGCVLDVDVIKLLKRQETAGSISLASKFVHHHGLF